MSVRKRTSSPGCSGLKPGQHRSQQSRYTRDRGYDQFAADRLALSLDPAGKLAELLLGRLRHPQKIAPGLGGGVAARMALEQPRAQPFFQRIDMPDHGCMMHPQHLGSTRYGAHACDLIGSPDLVPVVHAALDVCHPPEFSRCLRHHKVNCGAFSLAQISPPEALTIRPGASGGDI